MKKKHFQFCFLFTRFEAGFANFFWIFTIHPCFTLLQTVLFYLVFVNTSLISERYVYFCFVLNKTKKTELNQTQKWNLIHNWSTLNVTLIKYFFTIFYFYFISIIIVTFYHHLHHLHHSSLSFILFYHLLLFNPRFFLPYLS